ncbi:MAG: hypothetical protein JWQ32_1899 [Marmoricola sp.]|nr:hypothetical protein [Marmoricola sp.]
MSAPRYLPAFYVREVAADKLARIELRETGPAGRPGPVIARAEHEVGTAVTALTFFADVDGAVPVFSWRMREPGAFDVFDERDEAIGYFRADHLSAPYLEAVGTTGPDGRVEYHDARDPVLTVEQRSSAGVREVRVTDRRLALRLAAAVATELATRSH